MLADQVRNLDWNARRFEVVAVAPPEVIAEAIGKLETLLVKARLPC